MNPSARPPPKGTIPAETVVVPLASEDDATDTCTALLEHLDEKSHIIVVYVVEKAGGAPDKTGVEQSKEYAERLFTIARAHLESDDRSVDSQILYGTNIADTIFDAADDVDADLIAFSPREASRLVRFLTGDTALELMTNTERPVLVLPTPRSHQ